VSIQTFVIYGVLIYLQKRIIIKTVFSVFITSSLAAKLTYGSFLSIGIIMSTLNTSFSESFDFIKFNFLELAISILLCIGMIVLPTIKIQKKTQLLIISFGLLYLVFPTIYNYKGLINSKNFHNYTETGVARGLPSFWIHIEYLIVNDIGYRFPPLVSIRGISDTIAFLLTRSSSSSSWTGVTTRNDSPSLLIIGLGESLRSDHLSIYGYERNTTPKLLSNDKLMIYKNAYSGGTNTWSSVPAMFTKFSSQPDLSKSIINLAKDAGYETFWLSNQTKLSKWDFSVSAIALQSDYTYFSSTDDTRHIKYDSILLSKLSEILSTRNSNKKMLIILHFHGSHMSFKDRYPKEYSRFSGENPLIDQYDNSVLYTDHIISTALGISEKYNAKFLYFSDHGLGNPNGDIPLKHGVRKNPDVDSLKVPFISSEILKIRNKQTINLFYFECIFSSWSGIVAEELNNDYCAKSLSDDRITFYDANLNIHRIPRQ